MNQNQTTVNYNKFDSFDDPDFSYYRSKLEVYKKKDVTQKSKINELYKSLKVDSEPFYPKNKDLGSKDNVNYKDVLGNIDFENIKEYHPKNYKIVKKD